MENYKKGKNVEEPLDRYKIPIKNLPENFLWMQVRGGSKIRNLLSHALNEMPEAKHIVWTGFGPSVGKTVTCTEIMKREYQYTLHQITKICYRLVEEYWDPLLPELDQIVVKRKLPMIHIYLSIEHLDAEELGYQYPGQEIAYGSHKGGGDKRSNQRKKHKKNRNKEHQQSSSNTDNVSGR
ncbi:unnamed protein product [Acanthoscelides obtectus]|uniref:DNA/RNA-binding protein Alba-like domain-containing protein n=1 Tax=Acanthoscelides obtectus TaxID=200917 RepID=A0A9P0KLS4_ACAOB|nr:unnamed protein product [Acanthoscelides obtectus]CAK1622089.1 Ribonuclease P protein subunit p25-like protein [Acanthoscelides obtectus]